MHDPRPGRRTRARARRSGSTTSPSTGSTRAGWPSWPTRSRASSSARCAATASWWPRPRARPATTSPTAARCWRGEWRATWSRSSRRTRSRRGRSWWLPATGSRCTNRSREEDVEMTTDGRGVCVLPREGTIEIRFEPESALLAQLPGASFLSCRRDEVRTTGPPLPHAGHRPAVGEVVAGGARPGGHHQAVAAHLAELARPRPSRRAPPRGPSGGGETRCR